MINRDITEKKFLKEIEKIKLNNYDLIKTEENFFIWKKKDKKDFIRLCLMRKGFHNIVYYWNLELSFKPFAYKHNHRENANLKSEEFKQDDTNKYFNYFLNMLDKIKGVV